MHPDFRYLPDENSARDYYETITSPIALAGIKEKFYANVYVYTYCVINLHHIVFIAYYNIGIVMPLTSLL